MSFLNLKEQLSFIITFAKLWYGNGPYNNMLCSEAHDKHDPKEDRPLMYLELKVRNSELRRHLGKRPAIAHIYRDPTGNVTTSNGIVIRGQMTVGEINDDVSSHGFVQIDGLFPPDTYDATASLLIAKGSDLLSHFILYVGLKEERGKVDFQKREGPLNFGEFFIDDLAISYEIGRQYDELSDE